MNAIESTGQIRITRIPSGEAPFEIRKAWLGLILPCDPYLGYPDNGIEQGVLSGKKASRNRRGFSVPQDEALEILSLHNPAAATWWRENGFPTQEGYFGFGEGEAEIISGVTPQSIMQVTEEMMGDPGR